LQALGFRDADALALWEHFDDAERRGKPSHGHARIEWLETQQFEPLARPRQIDDGRLDGNGAVGYLVLARVVSAQIASPRARAASSSASGRFRRGCSAHTCGGSRRRASSAC